MQYIVVDTQTRAVVGKPYSDRNRARTRADKLDMTYGAHRYVAMPIDLYRD